MLGTVVFKTHHVGVVDEKLRVRTFTIETPNMWRRAHRFLFCYDDVNYDDWQDTISNLIVKQVEPALKFGKPADMFSKDHQDGFKTADQCYKLFDQNGKLVKNEYTDLEKKHEVKLAVSADRMLSTERFYQDGSDSYPNFVISWKILQAKCVPRQTDKPLFLAVDDKDE